MHRRGGQPNLSFSASSTDSEFKTDLNADLFSKTLPRNYNNSASTNQMSLAPLSISSQMNAVNIPNRQIGKLEYFDLDHSNPPPICRNSNTSASTSNLSSNLSIAGPSSSLSTSSASAITLHQLTNRISGFTPASALTGPQPRATDSIISTPGSASGVVYKSVDFVKTEAFKLTRQDAEKARLKNPIKE